MNRLEAERVAGEVLAHYRDRPWRELVRLIDEQDVSEVHGPSGKRYQVEVMAVWDDKKGQDIRVMTTIDDGGFSAYSPLSLDFIIASDGRFVGETPTSLAESLQFQTAVDELLATLQREHSETMKVRKARMEWRNTPGGIGWDIQPPTLAASPLSIVGVPGTTP